MTSKKISKPVNSVDGMASRPSRVLETKKKPKKNLKVQISKLPNKEILIGLALLLLLLLASSFRNQPVEVTETAPEQNVESIVDNPTDATRADDLDRLATALELYFESNNQLPSRSVLSSEVFINQYLGEFMVPDQSASYEFADQSTSDNIIGYRPGSVCSSDFPGTLPTDEPGIYSLHIIVDDNQFYCIDNTNL